MSFLSIPSPRKPQAYPECSSCPENYSDMKWMKQYIFYPLYWIKVYLISKLYMETNIVTYLRSDECTADVTEQAANGAEEEVTSFNDFVLPDFKIIPKNSKKKGNTTSAGLTTKMAGLTKTSSVWEGRVRAELCSV